MANGRTMAPARTDALLYTGGAALSLWCLTQSSFATHVLWGKLTWATYLVAAAASAALGLLGRPNLKARSTIACLVCLATLVVPLVVEVVLRGRHGTQYARSEVLVTEQSAGSALDGHDPYASTFLGGAQTHFPYLPLMPVFGMARALFPGTAWTDARVVFALTTVAAALAAVLLWPGPGTQRLRVLHCLLVLPPSTLLLTAGGDDLPVLAFGLVAVVLAMRGRFTLASVPLAAAALLKFTAWPLLSTLGLVICRRSPRSALPLAIVPLALLPFAVAHPLDFVDDTVLFPLGLASDKSGVRAPTLGSALMSRTGSNSHQLLALLLIVTAVVVAAWYAATRTITTVADATWVAGVAFTLLVVLAPVARPGYAIYPMNLLMWGHLLREREPRHAAENVRPADRYAYARAGS